MFSWGMLQQQTHKVCQCQWHTLSCHQLLHCLFLLWLPPPPPPPPPCESELQAQERQLLNTSFYYYCIMCKLCNVILTVGEIVSTTLTQPPPPPPPSQHKAWQHTFIARLVGDRGGEFWSNKITVHRSDFLPNALAVETLLILLGSDTRKSQWTWTLQVLS